MALAKFLEDLISHRDELYKIAASDEINEKKFDDKIARANSLIEKTNSLILFIKDQISISKDGDWKVVESIAKLKIEIRECNEKNTTLQEKIRALEVNEENQNVEKNIIIDTSNKNKSLMQENNLLKERVKILEQEIKSEREKNFKKKLYQGVPPKRGYKRKNKN